MTTALKRKSNQELLAEAAALPERLTGEVIDGELYVMSRPTPAHHRWTLLGAWTGAAVVTGVAPFPELSFELSRRWLTET